MTNNIRITILLFFSTLFFLISCRKNKYYTENDALLIFSEDTVLFDTIFTQVGSITEFLLVHNEYKEKINISSIKLAGGSSSVYRMNIDGYATTQLTNVEIAAGDSMYIFIEVTLDPNNQNNPLIITDSILFETNGNMQDVDLVAWGQDAYFHTYLDLVCDESWGNDKPHVVYGYAVVDSACTLTIEEGTEIYCHAYSGILVYKEASLKVEGTLDNPVYFQGDRLESYYKDKAGQWGHPLVGGIWLYPTSIDNEINYAVIRNGYIGVQVDTFGTSVNPTLTINNTIIENMANVGLYARGAIVKAENCVFANTALSCVALTIGGSYEFTHCTFANYWSGSSRDYPALLLNNWYEYESNKYEVRDMEKAYFGNCIMYGNIDTEIALDSMDGGEFNYAFEYCLIKAKEQDLLVKGSSFVNIYRNQDPKFKDVENFDFQLDTLSKAKDRGDLTIAQEVPFDLLGEDRLNYDGKPDLGAYERIE